MEKNTSILNLNLSEYQMLPPFTDDDKFEVFVLEIFNSIDNTNSYSRFGRSGQKQFGFDVFSIDMKTVIQCKLRKIDAKDKDIRKDIINKLNSDFESFCHYNKKNGFVFRKFILASTYKNDTNIQTECIRLTSNDITVEYWPWERLLANLSEEILVKYYSSFIQIISRYFSQLDSKRQMLDERIMNLSVLDKIYFLSQRFSPMRVLKQNSLLQFYPFNCNKHSYINRYNLKIEDDEIIGSIEAWNNTSLAQQNSKEREIMTFFRNNLIFKVFSDNKAPFKLRFLNEQCSCVLCIYESLDLEKFDNRLSEINNNLNSCQDIRDILVNAYINFKVYDFINAYNHLNRIFEIIKSIKKAEEKIITEFIFKVNINNLYNIWNRSANKKEELEILSKIKDINPYDSLTNINIDEQIKRQFEYILNGNFIKNISYNIDKALNSIRKYVEQNRNVQYHIEELIYQVCYLVTFTKGNYLFFDIFDDFKILIEKSLDGIFGAYSVQENIPLPKNQLSFFGSYRKIQISTFILDLCILYCNSDTLFSILKRYKIEELPIDNNFLLNKAYNLLKSPDIFQKYLEGNSYRLMYADYEAVLNNILFLLANSKDDIEDSRLIQLLLNFYSKLERHIKIDGLKFLLLKKPKCFNLKHLNTLFDLNINYYINDSRLFELIAQSPIYKDHKLENKKLIEKIIKLENYDFLYLLWHIVSDENKESISNKIKEKLEKTFDFYEYIDFCKNKIIHYNVFFNKALEFLEKQEFKGNYEKIGDKLLTDDNKKFILFMDLVYTFDIQLPIAFKEEYSKSSKYHKFLLNPYNISISDFDIEWLLIYSSDSFCKIFKEVKFLKELISNKLKTNYNKDLAEIYHKLY